jgi:opacity protein-like surface antigen
MKKCSLALAIVAALISVASAGPNLSSNKETAAPAPCPSWYADTEWNLGIWGGYAFAENDYPTLYNAGPFFPVDPDVDRYLETDHAWGGGIDVKYFFKRYFGIGLEGFFLDARQSYGHIAFGHPTPFHFGTLYSRQTIGSGLATFTLRYPIGCSRFAPYGWVGGGAIFGGGQVTQGHIGPNDSFTTTRSDAETKLMGQFGAGFEVRLTPHIGWTNDFGWNVVDGRDNNFGMARTGINFAF